jgi:aldehyde dehydrogenase (NAD+)
MFTFKVRTDNWEIVESVFYSESVNIDPHLQMNSYNPLQSIFDKQKDNQFIVARSSAKERILKLKRLREFLLAHMDEACQATYRDFKKPAAETIIGEMMVLVSEISYAIKNLNRWMKPERQPVAMTMVGTTSWIQYEAKGCVLIIAPWNYPITLALKPLVSAMSAGCVAMVKPSEMTPHSSAFVKKAIENLFSENEIAVVEGDAQVATELLKLPFNHIFFTGSPAVGKIVMKAAAENLASVTLELGGKSPSVIDQTADIPATARLIAWGKFFNNGQTCIAPDYVLIHESVKEKFINEIKAAVENMYGADGADASPNYARIVNDKHFHRLNGYLHEASGKGAVIETSGKIIEAERYIAPTVLTAVSDDMAVMQEEIFGPILPVMTYQDLDEAVGYIKGREKPLALYIHSKSNGNTAFLLKNTSAGNVLVNEVLTQFGNTEIPFGGVNNSGIGKSNGFYGFQEFSNAKGVMKRSFGTMRFLYPPYSSRLVKWLGKGLRYL